LLIAANLLLMTAISRQSQLARLFAGLTLAVLANLAFASEGSVEPTDLGTDIRGDTTEDLDSRSSEVATAAEQIPLTPSADKPEVPLADAVETADGGPEPLMLLGAKVAAGTSQRLSWTATELFEGVPVSTPVLVVNGEQPGPTLCLTAAIHGDELNGIEMVRRVMHDISPDTLSGAIIGVPIVNVQGFRRGSRYLPDRRDLNRYFPGNPNGSAAARIAHSFFDNVVSKCDALIDLHTGSFERANLPQIRADLRDPDVVTLTQGFGATVILHSTPGVGTLRHAATQAGIPTVTLEAGGPLQLELAEVKHGVKGIETLIATLGMMRRMRLWGDPEPVYYRSTWVRADSGGILFADVSLGSTVRKGDLLGTITDPMSNVRVELHAPYSGRIIGMARNQVVMPGFAAFHVGIQTVDAPTEPVDAAIASEAETPEDSAYIDGISEEE
jgi:predicted deacylase